MNKIKFQFLAILLSAAVITSCSDKLTTHKREANAFCEVFNPVSWNAFVNGKQPIEIQDELTRRVTAVVETSEFRQIFIDLVGQGNPQMDVYGFYRQRISVLLGEQWQCQYVKDYFSPAEFTRQTKEDLIEPDKTIEIVIDRLGNTYVDSQKIAKESLREALMTLKKDTVIGLELNVDGDAEFQHVSYVMDTAYKLGITSISVLTADERKKQKVYNSPELH